MRLCGDRRACLASRLGSLNRMMAKKVTFRGRPAVARFFNGLDLVDPGMAQAPAWRPASETAAASPAAWWTGAARTA